MVPPQSPYDETVSTEDNLKRALRLIEGDEPEISEGVLILLELTKRNYSPAWMRLGEIYLSNGEEDKAVTAFFKAAELGNVEGAQPLGYYYKHRGMTGPASYWFKVALAENRDALSAYELGQLYYQNTDFKQAGYYLGAAARMGLPQGVIALAKLFSEGRGGKELGPAGDETARLWLHDFNKRHDPDILVAEAIAMLRGQTSLDGLPEWERSAQILTSEDVHYAATSGFALAWDLAISHPLEMPQEIQEKIQKCFEANFDNENSGNFARFALYFLKEARILARKNTAAPDFSPEALGGAFPYFNALADPELRTPKIKGKVRLYINHFLELPVSSFAGLPAVREEKGFFSSSALRADYLFYSALDENNVWAFESALAVFGDKPAALQFILNQAPGGLPQELRALCQAFGVGMASDPKGAVERLIGGGLAEHDAYAVAALIEDHFDLPNDPEIEEGLKRAYFASAHPTYLRLLGRIEEKKGNLALAMRHYSYSASYLEPVSLRKVGITLYKKQQVASAFVYWELASFLGDGEAPYQLYLAAKKKTLRLPEGQPPEAYLCLAATRGHLPAILALQKLNPKPETTERLARLDPYLKWIP
jgi:tetratricopeptide (TPR) repeat protein